MERDIEILKKREEQKKEKYQTLEDGIYLDGRILNFERKVVLNTFTMLIPDTMKQMPKEYARIKYPSEFRPQQIFTTSDLDVNMGFTVFSKQIQQEDRMELLQQMQETIYRANQDGKQNACVLLKQVSGGYFTFRSHVMDSDLFQMMALITAGEWLIQGNFHCVYSEHIKWKRIVLLMLETIQILEKEEDTNKI